MQEVKRAIHQVCQDLHFSRHINVPKKDGWMRGPPTEVSRDHFTLHPASRVLPEVQTAPSTNLKWLGDDGNIASYYNQGQEHNPLPLTKNAR